MMWYVIILLFASYLLITWYALIRSASPALPCDPFTTGHHQCFRPLVAPDEPLILELWLYHPPSGAGNRTAHAYRWNAVDTCRFRVTAPAAGTRPAPLASASNDTGTNGTVCRVALPPVARRRAADPAEVRPLRARFALRRAADGAEVGGARFDLTRVAERRGAGSRFAGSAAARKLLAAATSNASVPATAGGSGGDASESVWIPYLKYGRSPVRLRFVAEYAAYGSLQRADGAQLQAWNRTHYRPMLYVDDLSLQHASQTELAPPEDGRPPIQLHVKLGAVSPAVDAFRRQLLAAANLLESAFAADELDEVRYFLQDERLYRFLLTQLISYVHMWVSYLAFRDEIRFYRGRKRMAGVSASSVITCLVCSVIIFLYLCDGGGTSWVVLLGILGECVVDAWKAVKLLQPTLTRRFPYVAWRQLQTQQERDTVAFDRIAMKYLAMVFYPIVAVWSLYALKTYEYASWYSWLISNLANAVYTFGFITLCPQLYVNYRMKSVAHLPWKVFMYKIFNTFIDDMFAFLIEMPLKHKIMTLRDDVVFVLFLVQVYIYRVDKARTNEFGYAYDEGPEDQLRREQIGQEKKEKQA